MSLRFILGVAVRLNGRTGTECRDQSAGDEQLLQRNK